VDYSPNQTRSVSPEEPLFIPTLRCSPVPLGTVRIYRTDSLSSDLSGTSHTSENSYTHDANKKPKKRILKQPHEKRNGHRSKHVHWRLDEVEDSRYGDDNTSLDSSDTYARIPDITGKKYNQGWDETDEQGKLLWRVNPQWNDRSKVMDSFQDGTPDELDIDLPFDESYLNEGTLAPSTHQQVEKLANVPSHQLTISPSDANSTSLLADELRQVQLQATPIKLQAIPIQTIDGSIQSVDTSSSSDTSTHSQETAATLTSTPIVLRKKNGVTNTNSMPPVLKLRDSMVCELEESIYDNKPNIFQFPDTSYDGSPGTARKVSKDVHQLSPLLEDTASLPTVLKINETSQLVENSIKSDSDQTSSQSSSVCSDDTSKNKIIHSDKDMMGQSIIATSSAIQEQSPSTHSSCDSLGDLKTTPSNTPSPSFVHAGSDSNLNTAKDFVSNRQNHPLNLNSASTSSLPVKFSSYMNQPNLQDHARKSSTLPHHGSPSYPRRQGSTSSLPAVTSSKISTLGDVDDIDTPMSELDASVQKKPVVRYKRHYSYRPESFKVNSPTSSRAKQRLEAIMRDIELEENHRINSIRARNFIGQFEGIFCHYKKHMSITCYGKRVNVFCIDKLKCILFGQFVTTKLSRNC